MIGKVTQVNIFHPKLSSEQMQSMTDIESHKCGVPGNILSWEDALWKSATGDGKFAWTLHGKARGASILPVDGPCQERSLLNFFTNTGLSAYGCMEHCQKLGYRAPAVTTLEQWENLLRELDRVTAKVFVYLPVTKGEVNNDLGRLVHWGEDVKFKKGGEIFTLGNSWRTTTGPGFSTNKDIVPVFS